MMLTWMITATLFAVLLGIAAVALERALRIGGRQARAAWFGALVAAVTWPVMALLVARGPSADAGTGPVLLPSVQTTVGAIAATLPALPRPWRVSLDLPLAIVWSIASIVLLVRLWLGRRVLVRAERAATRDVIAGLPLLVTPDLGPAVFGFRHQRILVPRWLLDLDAPLRALVVRHEEEHARAHDSRLALAASLAVALVPWNVGAWWIARRLRLAVEMDCDARVLRGGADAGRYARLLLFIAQRQSHTRLASMLAESNSHLSRRIHAMNITRPSNVHLRVGVLALGVIAALACSTAYASELSRSVAAAQSRGSTTAQSRDSTVTYYSPDGATPAMLRKSSPLTYPAGLRSARVSGEVVAQFVVDTSGAVLPGSMKVVHATDTLFVQPVRELVGAMRFTPASFKGRNVRQLVQQSFYFDVKGSGAGASKRPVVRAVPTSDPKNRIPMPLRPAVVSVP